MKDIVLFFDGTWEDGAKDVNEADDTNVYKLFKYLTPKPWVIPKYFTGVGTQNDGLGDFIGGVTGTGINKRVINAVSFIANAYRKGEDRITLIGFSRGAYIARCVTANLTEHGTPIYKVLVFDTVCSYLFKGLEKAEGNTLSRLVHRGFQILAQNEDRYFFQPQIWNEAPNVRQYRCRGIHTQIGGGNKKTGISDFTLKVAAKELKHLEFNLPNLKVNINEKPDPNFPRFTLGARKFPDYIPSIMTIADINGNLRSG